MFGYTVYYPKNSDPIRVNEVKFRNEIIDQIKNTKLIYVKKLIEHIGVNKLANLMLAISYHESNGFIINLIANRGWVWVGKKRKYRKWGDYSLFQLNLDVYDSLRDYSEKGDKTLLTSIKRNVAIALNYFDKYWYNLIVGWSKSMGWEKAIIKSWNSGASYESYIGEIYPKYLEYMKKYKSYETGLSIVDKTVLFTVCTVVFAIILFTIVRHSTKKIGRGK